MTKEELDAIRNRVNGALPAPWEFERFNGRYTLFISEHIQADFSYLCVNELLNVAEFISHAREDVPTLLAEIERYKKALRYIAITKNYDLDEIDIIADYEEVAKQALTEESE
jgi:cell division FtsZ-interacting protein ZapD